MSSIVPIVIEEEPDRIQIQVEQDQDDELDELEQELEEVEEVGWVEKHGKKVNKARANGKNKNKVVAHYNCNYCQKSFVGPSASSFRIHLKGSQPRIVSYKRKATHEKGIF